MTSLNADNEYIVLVPELTKGHSLMTSLNADNEYIALVPELAEGY